MDTSLSGSGKAAGFIAYYSQLKAMNMHMNYFQKVAIVVSIGVVPTSSYPTIEMLDSFFTELCLVVSLALMILAH